MPIHLLDEARIPSSKGMGMPRAPSYLTTFAPVTLKEMARVRAKSHRRLLERGDKNRMLRALPALHEEVFAKTDCLACAACCKGYSPRFKTPDIKRIAKRLRMKEGELVARYLRLDEENDYVTQSQPCPFLGDDNFCSIYEDRPSDCARYPYTDEDVLLKRVNLTLKNAEICPAVFGVLERLEKVA